MGVSTSGGVNCISYFKGNLTKWYKLLIRKKKIENCDFFRQFRWRPEVTPKIFNPLDLVYKSTSIIPESLKCLSYLVFEKMRNKYLNLWTPYLTTGSKTLRNFLTLLEIFVVSTIYVNFKSNTLFISEIYGSEKWENETLIWNNRKSTFRLPVG